MLKLSAFGLTFDFEQATVDSGIKIIDTLVAEGVTPVACITELSQELELTSAASMAIYTEWANRKRLELVLG